MFIHKYPALSLVHITLKQGRHLQLNNNNNINLKTWPCKMQFMQYMRVKKLPVDVLQEIGFLLSWPSKFIYKSKTMSVYLPLRSLTIWCKQNLAELLCASWVRGRVMGHVFSFLEYIFLLTLNKYKRKMVDNIIVLR